MLENSSKYILHIAEWFPNSEDPQLGIFIVKHIQVIQKFQKCLTIVIEADKDLNQAFIIEKYNHLGLDILKGTYKQYTKWQKIRNRWNYWRLLFHIMKKLEISPSAIHVHAPRRSTLLVSYFSKIWNCPYIISEHWHGWLNKSYRPSIVRKSFFKRANRITAVSKTLAISIQEKTTANVKIVPNIVPEIKVKEQKVTKKKIIVVADLVDNTKNITGILTAFKTFQIDHKDWQLDIIGDGPDGYKIKGFVIDNEIKGVQFLGRLPNDSVLALYEGYDFLISFSNFETFGLTLAEALAAGIPVIATKCGGPEAFINENNGILVNPGDEKALTAAMKAMTRKKDSYTVQSLQRSVAQFQAPAVQNAFRNLYSDLVDIE